MRAWKWGAAVGAAGVTLLAVGAWTGRVPDGPGPATAEARDYLDDALDLLRDNHVNRGDADWPTLESAARAAADGAKTPAETYPAIRLVLERLGEKHSTLYKPPPPRPADAAAGPASPPKPRPQPEGRLVDGRYGHVTVTQFGGSREKGAPYADRIRGFIREFDRAGACGWIVDVRGNGGGNVWPMLDGVGPLLGGTEILSFDIVGDRIYQVRYENGVAVQAGGPSVDPPADPVVLRDPLAPVAILMDGGTASSAEALVIAFAGRPHVRTFGKPTADYISVNNVFPLEDGAALAVTMGWNRDRTGRIYREAIQPDEPVPGDGEAPVRAAADWLSQHPACRS